MKIQKILFFSLVGFTLFGIIASVGGIKFSLFFFLIIYLIAIIGSKNKTKNKWIGTLLIILVLVIILLFEKVIYW
ncbi:hypothetical protein [Paenibacillus koleovorans]|uniref:hypothetical protein n=1 Tax=Paenibacillus koleovorans TaxID=121608 RepID=UPI000FDACDDF|nr:hypothetical protein [Paenibacillus koleovorans]